MKRFDPRFAKYSKKNPDLTLAEAKQSKPRSHWNHRNGDESGQRNKRRALILPDLANPPRGA